MKLIDVINMLESTGYPVVYLAWRENEVPALPYICYYYPSMTPETADDTHHAEIYTLNVELYTKNKNFEVESTVEAALLNADMVFTKEEDFLSDENMYETLYIMEVNING